MESLATGRCVRMPWRKACLVAVLLLSSAAANGGREILDGGAFPECMHTNLYWHGQDDCFLTNLPRWYAGADMLVLRRDLDSVDDRSFAFNNVAALPLVARLGSDDFVDEFDAGIRVMLGYALNDWYRIEGLYYGSYFFDDATAIRTPGANDLRFLFGDTGSFASIRYSSDLNNFEINLRNRLDMPPGPLQVSLLFGGRFMKLDESFLYRSDGAVVSSVDVNTSNDLIGMQIGLMGQWQTYWRSWLDYEIKGAVFTNRAEQSTTSNVFAGTMGARKDVTAFAVDMSLVFNCQLTPSVTLRFGYNAMWLDGVALGVGNVERNVNLLTLGPANVIHNGSVVYHGPSFGIVWVR